VELKVPKGPARTGPSWPFLRASLFAALAPRYWRAVFTSSGGRDGERRDCKTLWAQRH
jgi:hypothetical protein